MKLNIGTGKTISLVYDYIGPYSLVPNGLNYRYLTSHIKYSFDQKLDILPELSNTYDDGVSVFDGEYLLHMFTEHRLSVNEVPLADLESVFLYPVSIHGAPNAAFGSIYSIHENFPFTRFISTKALEYIQDSPNFFLFINYTTEGISDTRWYHKLYTELEYLNIPPSKVIFSSATYTLQRDFDKWYSTSNQTLGKIHVLPFNWTFPTKHIEFKNITYFTPNDIEYNAKGYTFLTEDKIHNNLRPFKFLMFNRRLRVHRIYSILYIYYKKIIDQFLISYNFIDKNCNLTQGRFKPEKNLLKEFTDNEIAQELYLKIQNTEPVKTVDYDNIGEISGVYYENFEPYSESYINVVTETNFFEAGGYISEKTTKPLANLQPFIVIGTPFILKELRELGFKTFHPYINEEYDNIVDNDLRLQAVLDETYRISQIPIEEIHKWYQSILPILIHNQKLLLDSEFFSNYLNKIQSNIISIYENNTESR